MLAQLRALAREPLSIDVLGLNFYPQWSTQQLVFDKRGRLTYRKVEKDGAGFAELIELHHRRYAAPVMITETSSAGGIQTRAAWLDASLAAVRNLRARSVPVIGYTWFPLYTMIDWRYRFGKEPIERYRVELGMYRLASAAEARWQPTPLVARFRRAAADPLTPVGEPCPVTRPHYDWQLYDPQRPEKGGVRWHTIEGSFVLKRKGRYYQMFSGGNWQNLSYGVSYAISESIDTSEEWVQVADGERVVPILRSVPGQVIGPGHNSVVRGPNNQELLCVYHRWAADTIVRVMALDRLDWAGERMLLLGPNTTPQPVYPPSCADFFDGERADGLGSGWSCVGGSWAVSAGAATQQSLEPAAARCSYNAEHYTAEVSARALHAEGDGAYGVAIGDQARFLIQPSGGRALAQIRHGNGWATTELPLPAAFDAQAYHLLRVELSAGWLTVALDEASARWQARLADGAPMPIALVSERAAAAFAGFALTEGWSDLFWPGQAAPAAWGWGGAGGWRIADGELASNGGDALFKGPLPVAYELVVNARVNDASVSYGFYPSARSGDPGPLVVVEQSADGLALSVRYGERSWICALPASFDPTSFQQLRALVRAGRISLSWEGLELGSIDAPAGATQVGLWAGGPAHFELVRVTALPA